MPTPHARRRAATDPRLRVGLSDGQRDWFHIGERRNEIVGDAGTEGAGTERSSADVANQHIIEDLVDINFGPTVRAPRLVFEEIGSRQVATAQAIKLLVDAGVIRPDRQLEESVRTTLGLPSKDTSTSSAAPTTTATE